MLKDLVLLAASIRIAVEALRAARRGTGNEVRAGIDPRFANIAPLVLRYALALIFVWFGALKYIAYTAEGVSHFAMTSPFLSWAYDLLDKQGFARALGTVEMTIGVLLAVRPLSAKLATVGGFAACITFVVTLSLLFTTPGVIQQGYAFPALSGMTGQFLIKDVVLLGAALRLTGEALRMVRIGGNDVWARSPGAG